MTIRRTSWMPLRALWLGPMLVSIVVANTSLAWGGDWDEAINGDLSNDGFNPTFFPMAAGSNWLKARTGSPDPVDYFTFTLDEGQELVSVMHRSYTGNDRLAFISIMNGPLYTESRGNPDPGNMLGWTHFGRGQGNVGEDLLPLIGVGAGSQRFTPPLTSGSYAVWLQQIGSTTDYELEWVVTGAPPSVAGDLDGDGIRTAADIDLLSESVRTGNGSPEFDLNGDAQVNGADRTYWINELVKTYVGDSNLDLEFNSGDFVEVFQAGQYEDAVPMNSGWATGDWDGDGDFTSGDFVGAFQEGSYESGPRRAAVAVPEPDSWLWLLALLSHCVVRPGPARAFREFGSPRDTPKG